MRRTIGRLGVAGVAIGAVGIWMPVTAGASPALSHLRAHPVNASSTAFAGYYKASPTATASASAKFKVPTLTCTSALSGEGPGAYVASSTEETVAAVFDICSSGTPSYEAVIVIDNTQTVGTFAPAAGDVITVSATQSASVSKATLKDVTQSKTLTGTSAVGSAATVVLNGIDSLASNGTQVPTAKFSLLHFSSGKIDGGTVLASGAIAVDQKTSGGVLQIKTGALNAAGNAWTETWHHL